MPIISDIKPLPIKPEPLVAQVDAETISVTISQPDLVVTHDLDSLTDLLASYQAAVASWQKEIDDATLHMADSQANVDATQALIDQATGMGLVSQRATLQASQQGSLTQGVK